MRDDIVLDRRDGRRPKNRIVDQHAVDPVRGVAVFELGANAVGVVEAEREGGEETVVVLNRLPGRRRHGEDDIGIVGKVLRPIADETDAGAGADIDAVGAELFLRVGGARQGSRRSGESNDLFQRTLLTNPAAG